MSEEKERKKILVIEDESELAAALEVRLSSEGYNVVVARDGEEGLKKVVEENPSLIVLDILLPGIDGYEVCARLRADRSRKYIPIVMLTVKFQEEDVAEGYLVGADAYITKPFDPKDLMHHVRMLLEPDAKE